MSPRNTLRNPKLNQEFFTNLPSEIVIDILSRLPVRTIISCKCVCKSWLYLLKTDEFVKAHLSKSVPGLAIFEGIEYSELKFFEFEDRLDLEHLELHYDLVTSFTFPYVELIKQGSVNGLIFLRNLSCESRVFYIWNPITHEYLKLHCPREFVSTFSHVVAYGFGVSKMTGQQKVVGIFHDSIRDRGVGIVLEVTNFECQLYTLGTGSWRSIAPGAPLMYSGDTFGAFLNGNLYWSVFDLDGCPCISCFDIETELFSTVSSPPLPLRCPGSIKYLSVGLFALGDCLCLCDNSSNDEIVIWLMKEYGVDKFWTKEFVLTKFPDFAGWSYADVRPIKVFRDGDILMVWESLWLFYYSKKNKTTQKIRMFETPGCITAILYTPSFFHSRVLERRT